MRIRVVVRFLFVQGEENGTILFTGWKEGGKSIEFPYK